MTDDRRQKALDYINSLDAPEETKQLLHSIGESLTMVEQHPLGVDVGINEMLKSLSDAEEAHRSGKNVDRPEMARYTETITNTINIFNRFYDTDPTQYRRNMKTASVPMMVVIIEDLAKGINEDENKETGGTHL